VKVGITAYAVGWVHKAYNGGRPTSSMSIEDTATRCGTIYFNDVDFPLTIHILSQRQCHLLRGRRQIHQFEDGSMMSASVTEKIAAIVFENFSNSEVTSTSLANGRVSLEINTPGFNKADVLLSVNERESVVILKGKLDADAARGKQERTVDAPIPLRKNADLSDLKARMENEVLRVDVGKREFEGKHIQVE
ncbi:hypothetical protein HDU78_008204, partial [Chytriomyces hyalinus]